jgi:hypothetical protein
LWVPAAVAVVAVSAPLRKSFSCLPIERDWAPDLQIARSLAGLHGRLFTTFDWGEYAIWHFGPSLRVSMDGRRETVYSDEVIQFHRRFERGDPEAQQRFTLLSPDYVWLPARRVEARRWLEANGYRVDVASTRSFIAVRGNQPVVPAASERMPACFP